MTPEEYQANVRKYNGKAVQLKNSIFCAMCEGGEIHAGAIGILEHIGEHAESMKAYGVLLPEYKVRLPWGISITTTGNWIADYFSEA